jgi:hypothetical protein
MGKKTITITLDPVIVEKAKAAAVSLGLSLSAFISLVIAEKTKNN